MRLRPRQLLVVVLLLVVSAIVRAQIIWQPTSPPLVTAEHEPWYLTAEPLIWSGAYFYPAGAQVFFNGNQMVRSGSFRGVPLYTDATREALSVLYVPLAGGLMQPYERRRSGELAGTTGNTAPSFPVDIGAQGSIEPEGLAVDIAQNPGPPDFARPYDVAPLGDRSLSTRPAPALARPSVSAEAIAAGGKSIVYAPRVAPGGKPARRLRTASGWTSMGAAGLRQASRRSSTRQSSPNGACIAASPSTPARARRTRFTFLRYRAS